MSTFLILNAAKEASNALFRAANGLAAAALQSSIWGGYKAPGGVGSRFENISVTPPVTVSLVVQAHFRMFVSLRPAREVRRYLYEGPFGRDETLAHLSFACAEMLSARTVGNAKRVLAFTHRIATHVAEKYTNLAVERPDYRGGCRSHGSARSRNTFVRTWAKASRMKTLRSPKK